MSKTRQQKQEIVKKLAEKLSQAKAVVFADYKGLTMKQLSELRNKLREVSAEFTITKNTLLKRALSETEPGMDNSILKSKLTNQGMLELSKIEGPTATLFSYDDEISPIKMLVKAFKDAGIGKIKGGFLGSDYLDEVRLISLSNLPTKDELRGKTVGVLVAPLQGIVGVLQGNLRNLVYALSEINNLHTAEQKAKGGV